MNRGEDIVVKDNIAEGSKNDESRPAVSVVNAIAVPATSAQMSKVIVLEIVDDVEDGFPDHLASTVQMHDTTVVLIVLT
eukprot:gene12898-27211_t